MKSKRQISGAKAKQNGKVFEQLIEDSCRYYSQQGIAEITKTPEPHQIIGSMGNNQFKTVIAKKAQPDFSGTLQGGISLRLEAKHTNGTSIRFDRVNEIQAQYMDLHSKIGALCLIVVSFKLEKFYTILWSEWKRIEEETGKKSCNQKDLSDYEVFYQDGRLKFLERVDLWL